MFLLKNYKPNKYRNYNDLTKKQIEIDMRKLQAEIKKLEVETARIESQTEKEEVPETVVFKDDIN